MTLVVDKFVNGPIKNSIVTRRRRLNLHESELTCQLNYEDKS